MEEPTDKEFRTSKGWSLFMYLCGPLLICLFLYTLYLPFKEGNYSPNATWIIIPIALAMIAVMSYGIIDIYKGRFIIKEDRITSINTFSTKELLLEEIKGYTSDQYYIHITSNQESKSEIRVSQYYGNTYEIQAWLSQRFPNLDELESRQEKQSILKNNKFGETKIARAQALKTAEKKSKVINTIGSLSALWAFFHPVPYKFVMLLCIAMPIVSIVAIQHFKGLIKIDQKTESAHPSVVYALMYPSLVLMARAIFDFNILDYSMVWPWSLGLTILISSWLYFVNRSVNDNYDQDNKSILIIIPFFLAYSFSTILYTNCCYDNSETQYHQATVIKKRKNDDDYYLYLTPWGDRQKPIKTEVSLDRYNNTEVTDQIILEIHKGRLGIPWYDFSNE